jgi:hypothetical protein
MGLSEQKFEITALNKLSENKEWVSDLIFSIIYISALGSSHQLQVVVYHFIC